MLKIKTNNNETEDVKNNNQSSKSKLKFSNSSKKKIKNMSNPNDMAYQMSLKKLNASKLLFNNDYIVSNPNTDRSLFD